MEEEGLANGKFVEEKQDCGAEIDRFSFNQNDIEIKESLIPHINHDLTSTDDLRRGDIYACMEESKGYIINHNDNIGANPSSSLNEPKTKFEEEINPSESYFHKFRSVCAILVCLTLLVHSLRSDHTKISRRSQPMQKRSACLRMSLNGAGKKLWSRIRFLDEDENNINDDDIADDVNGDDVNGNYYNAENEEQEEEYNQEPVYIEDDFFRYIDDDGTDDPNLFPLETSDIVGLLAASMSLILAVGGGIGPGAILVALYIIVMDFPAKHAIPLSCVTGLGGSIATLTLNFHKRHPLTDRPLIDWDLLLIMEPITLLGAITGTYLNKILPERIIVTMLVLLLSVISHHTLKKARKMHRAETTYIKRFQWAKAKEENKNKQLEETHLTSSRLAEADPPFVPRVLSTPKQSTNNEDLDSSTNKLVTPDNAKERKNKETVTPPRSSSKSSFNVSPFKRSSFGVSPFRKSPFKYPTIEVQIKDAESVKSSIIVEEADPLPQNKITYIFTMFLFVIATNTFKGGGSFESPLGIVCGSVPFWIVEIITASWLLGCTYLAGMYLLRRHAIKEEVGFDYVTGDIRWDVRTIVIYPSVCMIAGIVSGMFGIGSAIITAPTMIGIGINPSVAAATSGCMNFFTSLAATSSFVVLGALIPDYAITCFIMGFGSTYFGRYIMTQASKKRGRRLDRHSYIAYSMGIVVLISALLMTAEALWSIYNHSFRNDGQGICDHML